MSKLLNHHLFRCAQDARECQQCKEFHKENPVPNDFLEVLGLPNRNKNGASAFVPEVSQLGGKNKTYIEQCKSLEENPRKQVKPDSDLEDIERCKVSQVNFYFHFLSFCIGRNLLGFL